MMKKPAKSLVVACLPATKAQIKKITDLDTNVIYVTLRRMQENNEAILVGNTYEYVGDPDEYSDHKAVAVGYYNALPSLKMTVEDGEALKFENDQLKIKLEKANGFIHYLADIYGTEEVLSHQAKYLKEV